MSDQAITLTVLNVAFTRFNTDRRSPVVSADGWIAGKAADGSWGLTPETARILDADESVELRVRDLEVNGKPAGQAHIVASYYNFGDYRAKLAADVLIQSGPSPDTGTQDRPFLDFGWVGSDVDRGDTVYVTEQGTEPIQNTLVIAFGNPNPAGGQAAPPAGDALFHLSFLLADDDVKAPADGALTTVKYASGVLNGGHPIAVESDDADWKPQGLPDFANDNDRHVWTFKPSRLPAPNRSVRLIVRDISVPYLQTGQPSFKPDRTTYAFLQYANVPGCRDGYYFLPIRKEKPHRAILKFFNITDDVIEPGDPVTLCWQTLGVARLELTFESEGKQVRSSDSADPHRHIERNVAAYAPQPGPSEKKTTYHLAAYDRSSPRPIDKRSEDVDMMLPAIVSGSFKMEPALPRAGQPVKLQWKTTGATACTLTVASNGSLASQPVPLQSDGHVITPVARTTVYDLVASRKTRSDTSRVTVALQWKAAPAFPLPPFPFDDTLEPVTAASPNEWAVKVLGDPHAVLWKGNFDAQDQCVLSGFDPPSWQIELRGATVAQVVFFAVAGSAVSRGAVLDFYPRFISAPYSVWNGGWVSDVRARSSVKQVNGCYWFRRDLQNGSVWQTFRTSADRDIVNQPPPFRIWAFRLRPR
jgi:hypothetical protein